CHALAPLNLSGFGCVITRYAMGEVVLARIAAIACSASAGVNCASNAITSRPVSYHQVVVSNPSAPLVQRPSSAAPAACAPSATSTSTSIRIVFISRTSVSFKEHGSLRDRRPAGLLRDDSLVLESDRDSYGWLTFTEPPPLPPVVFTVA